MSDSSSSGDYSVAGPSTVKRKKYAQKYKKEWELRPEFSGWLQKCESNPCFASCKSCNKQINISSGFDAIKKHAASKIHEKSSKSLTAQPKIIDFVDKKVVQFKQQVREGEIRVAGFVAEHNLPYTITDHLSKLIAKICPEDKVAASLKCSRPRIQAIVENVVGKESFTELCEDLKHTKFSLIIDESTDRSTTKHLCLVVRYVKKNNVVDSFLGLLPVVQADATTLHNCIISFFSNHNIPYKENLVGFASDGANVMMGSRHSVMSLLKAEFPNLFIMKCICHSFHLCASYACEKLPRFIEDFIRDVHNYFSSSPKRTAEFKEFQTFCNLKIHKLLHPCQTRWLSVHAAVARVLEQYPALKLYFIDAAENGDILAASSILQKLMDPVTLLFLQFLDFVLPIFNKMNKEMQAQYSRVHVLYANICDSLNTLFECFLKRDYIAITNIENIDYKNPHNFIDINDMYVGASALESLLKENLTVDQKTLFKTRCLMFYIEACEQIIQRFPLKNNPLKVLNIISPENVKKGNHSSIIPVCIAFPNLLDPKDYQKIDTEWRLLRNTKEISTFEDNAEKFWLNVANIKSGNGEPTFKTVTSLAFTILSLPHSSANVERIFSSINLMKTKQRNCLSTEAIIGLLHTKRLIGNDNCFDFNITKNMITKMSSQRWYDK